MEEQNFYRLKQSKARFKQYSASLNHCFETSRPDEFTTGYALMSGKGPQPPPDKINEGFTDGQLYMPNVFQLDGKSKLST